MVIRHVLDEAPLFSEMPESVRASLASVASVRRWRGSEHLWRSGDAGDNLQVVHEGLVLIGTSGPEGEEIVLHVVARGDCMGEPSIYAPNRERQTDARAVGRTTVVHIPGERVRPILEGNPDAMRVFVRRVSELCRSHARRVAATAFHDARGRLARVLLDLLASHGEPVPAGHRISVALSQRTLAGLVSLRRERVNRLVGQLESEGALRIEDGFITVVKPQVLRSALGADGAQWWDVSRGRGVTRAACRSSSRAPG